MDIPSFYKGELAWNNPLNSYMPKQGNFYFTQQPGEQFSEYLNGEQH